MCCDAGRSGGGPPLKEVILTLASFAVTKLAYVRLTKRFREEYARASGVDVRFRLAFAGSGVQVGHASHRIVWVAPRVISSSCRFMHHSRARGVPQPPRPARPASS